MSNRWYYYVSLSDSSSLRNFTSTVQETVLKKVTFLWKFISVSAHMCLESIYANDFDEIHQVCCVNCRLQRLFSNTGTFPLLCRLTSDFADVTNQ